MSSLSPFLHSIYITERKKQSRTLGSIPATQGDEDAEYYLERKLIFLYISQKMSCRVLMFIKRPLCVHML